MEEARESNTKKKRSLAVTSSTAGGGVGLTDDLVIEILSRVPVKSICRFKCVSSSWRNLISHPDNRKKLPRNLTGFFYFYHDFDAGKFVSLVEPPRMTGCGCLRPPSPCDFLPENTREEVVDCCNGLILLNNYDYNDDGSGCGSEPSYVICNPATEKWTSVPGSGHADKLCSASILCFDPTVSVHFHVVELLNRDRKAHDDANDEEDWFAESSMFEGFNIYSSETGAWVFHPHSHWSPVDHRRIYFNGLLHCITDLNGAVAALDMEGQTRRVIPAPRGVEVGLIGHSQGRLLYANRGARRSTSKLSIYVLGENGRWTLKHRVDTTGLFADADEYLESCQLVGTAAFHPHRDSIFLFDSLQGRLMSCSLDSQRGHVIRTVTKSSYQCFVSLLPYVPLYMETAALENSS